MVNDVNFVIELEQQLLSLTVRKDKNQLKKLLSADFYEIGASGRTYNFDAIIEMLSQEEKISPVYSAEFKGHHLTDDIVFLTYKTSMFKSFSSGALRSSIWSKKNDQWKIIFHQGTKFSS